MARKQSTLFWIIAVVITLSSAVYQRMTGPTYPIRGKSQIGESIIKYKLARSHGDETDHRVEITAEDTAITAQLIYKRYKTDDPWTTLDMKRDAEKLLANLPLQPPAGKLMYRVIALKDNEQLPLGGKEPIVIRFKGSVPIYFLLPHVILMFFAMLLSNRAGIEAISLSGNLRQYVLWTMVLLFLGGMILGPIVQKFAFGEYWTGYPWGTDLTDNKTAIGMLAWIVAWTVTLFSKRNAKSARILVITAAVVLLLIYLIPHSMFGSEFDYSKMPE